MDRKQGKLIGEITCLTNAIVYYEVHVVVGCRLVGYFFLKILKANISKKLNFLFSNALPRRTAGLLAMDAYGHRFTQPGRQWAPKNWGLTPRKLGLPPPRCFR